MTRTQTKILFVLYPNTPSCPAFSPLPPVHTSAASKIRNFVSGPRRATPRHQPSSLHRVILQLLQFTPVVITFQEETTSARDGVVGDACSPRATQSRARSCQRKPRAISTFSRRQYPRWCSGLHPHCDGRRWPANDTRGAQAAAAAAADRQQAGGAGEKLEQQGGWGSTRSSRGRTRPTACRSRDFDCRGGGDDF